MISRQAPERAITARFGGEEFVLFLPDTNAAEAAQIADTLREIQRCKENIGACYACRSRLSCGAGRL